MDVQAHKLDVQPLTDYALLSGTYVTVMKTNVQLALPSAQATSWTEMPFVLNAEQIVIAREQKMFVITVLAYNA